MKIKVNDYECVMFIPNINYWYEEGEPKCIFIGWLIWGVCIYFGDTTKVRKSNADIILLKEDGWLISGVCISFGDTTKVRKSNADKILLKEDE